MPDLVYKICPAAEWRDAEAAGRYGGSAADRADGFIHLSTAAQLPGTASRHFSGQGDLVLVTVDAAALGVALRFEPSRRGELFPHLYGPLLAGAVIRVEPLPLRHDGAHDFPADLA